jgi:hypothetical protein
MTAEISFKLYELFFPIIKEETKARDIVTNIEKIIENKFVAEKDHLASKKDLAEMETRITKTIYIIGLVQFLAIVGSVLAIVTFMLK